MKAIRCIRRGFTLVEVLLVISVISALGAIGYVATTGVKENATEAKLESDVATVNRAIQLYRANGGTIPNGASADQVLTKLKTRADSASAAVIGGMKGNFLDVRTEAVAQTGSEAATSQLRAVWDGAKNAFVTTRSSGAGIKEFRINDDLASADVATEARTANLQIATESQWVWDYASRTVDTSIKGGGVSPSAASAIAQGWRQGTMVVTDNSIVTDNLFFDGGGYRSELGLFSLEGMEIYDVRTASGLLAFMREAVRRVREAGRLGGVIMDRDGRGRSLTNIPVGTVVGFIMIPNASFADSSTYLGGSSPTYTNVRYPITSLALDTGIQGFTRGQTVDLGNNVFAMEDLPENQDFDYEDVVVRVNGVSDNPGSSIVRQDPATYYSNYDDPRTSTVENRNLLDTRSNTLLDGSRPTLRDALRTAGALP